MNKQKHLAFEKIGKTAAFIVMILLYLIVMCSLLYVRSFNSKNKQDKIDIFCNSSSINRYITQLDNLCERIAFDYEDECIKTSKNKMDNYLLMIKQYIDSIDDTYQSEELNYIRTGYYDLKDKISAFYQCTETFTKNIHELKKSYNDVSQACYLLHKHIYFITENAYTELNEETSEITSYIDFLLVTVSAIYGIVLIVYIKNHKKYKRQHRTVMYNNSLLEILSQNIDTVFVVRNKDNTSNEYVSKNSKKVLGFDHNEMLSDDQLIYKQMSKAWSSRIKREHIRNSDLPVWHITGQYTHPDTGKLIYLNKRIFNVETEGEKNIHKYIYLYENQTDMILTQTSLQQALRAAQAASEAKSSFLSNMSHDIRTPMHAIIGMTTLARMNIQDTDKVIDCLSKITTSSNHLLGLVSQILDMSRIENGKMTLNKQYFNLIHFINNIEDIVCPRIKSRNICFIIDRSQLQTEMIYGDELRLSQIIINFIDNATKYNKEGGSIRFTISEQKSMKKNYTEITFEIKDTGCGMSEEFRKKIFEPFERDYIAETNKIEGTGLGMSISRKLINLMGGQVIVQSQLNVGTAIQVIIGFNIQNTVEEISETAAALSEERTLDFDFFNKRILVVDDMDMNVNIVKGFLEKTKICVESASSGEAAVDMIKNAVENYYDLVFLDIHMTGIDGYETCRRIRALERADIEKLPIVAITADAFTEDVMKAKEAGMNGHISKPFQINELLHVVREYVI